MGCGMTDLLTPHQLARLAIIREVCSILRPTDNSQQWLDPNDVMVLSHYAITGQATLTIEQLQPDEPEATH
jgi:hypothetical protein